MSLRSSEIVKRWKERHRSQSGTSEHTDAAGSPARPLTAVNAWPEYTSPTLPKTVEDAVVAAFSSEAFRNVVASLVQPSMSKQTEKINQLKLANLNLESTVQTRLDELPSLLQPAIDHMTSIRIPDNDKELEKLAAGQDGCFHLLEKFDERMEKLENQLQGFDGRMKALEDKVVNADLRSAIRFGEISNELQDRNATLSDRLWEIEREVGGKVDGQQRRVVGLCEDLSKAIRKTQDKISALETTQAAKNDDDGPSNSELLEKIERMSKSVAKLDAMESSLRREIHSVNSKVSSLDTSALESYPRKLDAIDRTMSNLKSELETQGTLASLDSKLLSSYNARLDTVVSNMTKIEYLLESVKEDVSDDEVIQSHTEKLELLESKIAEVIGGVGAVQKHVSILDTFTPTSYSTRLEDVASGMTRIESHLRLLDTTPLSSQSEALKELKSTVAEMRANIEGGLSSQDKSLDVINEKISLLPASTKLDFVLESLEDTKNDTSNRIESLSNSLSKICDVTASTQEALSAQSTTLDSTSQALISFQTETSNILSPISSKLDDVNSRIGLGNDALSTVGKTIHDLIIGINSQGSDLAEIKSSTGPSDIILALKKAESAQKAASSTLNDNLEEIQKKMQEMHGSTMSEIRHKNASILSEVQKSNNSHAEHAASFVEVKVFYDALAKTLERNFTKLSTAGKESQTHIESISTALDTARHVNAAHGTALKEILGINRQHSTSLAELSTSFTKLLNGQENSVSLAETHASAIATLYDSIFKKEEVEVLQTRLGDILGILEKHGTALGGVSTAESIASLSDKLSESCATVDSNVETMKGEFQSLKALLDSTGPLGTQVLAENTKLYRTVSEVLEETRSNKTLIEKHASTAGAEGAATMEEIQALKGLVIADIASELSGVKELVMDVKDSTKSTEIVLHPQLRSIIFDANEKTSTCISTILNALESLKETSATAQVLESVANLHSLVEDHHRASLSPQIFQLTTAIDKAMKSNAQSIEDVQQSIQTIKDHEKASLVVSEIGTLKETALGNATSLLAIHNGLNAVGGRIKDSEDVLSKSIQGVHAAISEDGTSRKKEIDSVDSDIKALEITFSASANALRDDLKAVKVQAQENGKAIDNTLTRLSNINGAVSKMGDDVNGLLIEHLPKLSQDIRTINLSKLNTAAVTTEKALTSIGTTLDELSQLSKGRDTRITELNGKIVQASDLTSNEIANLQTSLQALNTTLSRSAQEATKSHNLLQSQTTILDNIHSHLQSDTSTTTALSDISSELSTITPAVRINSAAISRVDRAVLETGAQIKSLVLEGNSKLLHQIETTLESVDESLHDSSTRMMGISDFDLPRLELAVKGVEGAIERGIGGTLRVGRRNGDKLSVIGARVVGTQKMFDEMVEVHGREEGMGTGGRSLEGSGVLSLGRPDHRRLGSGRFRAPSNASSGKDTAGSGFKGGNLG